MRTALKTAVAVAALSTLAVVAVWLATGAHFYTKYEVVERVEAPVASDDPLAGTGFYDSGTRTETSVRDEFHLGLLPTPQGLFDKHLLSVASVAAVVWALTAVVALLKRRWGKATGW